MVIQVDFPDDLALVTKEEKTNFARRVTIYTLGHLYQEGKISAGIGAEILNCSKEAFYLLLSEYGFSIIDYEDEEWEDEIQTSKIIANHHES